MVNKLRANLLGLIKDTATSKTAVAVQEAHAKLQLPEPTMEEIVTLRNETPERILSIIANRYVEWLLDIRTKPLKRGVLKEERDAFQKEVLFCLQQSVEPKSKKVKEQYDKLAVSISRLIALYYIENEKQPKHVEGRLEQVLPFLAHHLLAEVELCVEARFSDPYKNLSKISVFEIDQKLRMLEAHGDAIVRDNARTIIGAALNKGSLALADTLVEGAQKRYEELTNSKETTIRNRARKIVSNELNDGKLLFDNPA